MKRRFWMIAFLPLLAAVFTAPTWAVSTVAPTDKNLLYVGRWNKNDSAHPHGDWIGSYVRADFTGTSVAVTLGGRSGMDVIVDGEPPRVVVGGPGVVPLNPAPLRPGRHTLLVGVKGGGGWDFQGPRPRSRCGDPAARAQAGHRVRRRFHHLRLSGPNRGRRQLHLAGGGGAGL